MFDSLKALYILISSMMISNYLFLLKEMRLFLIVNLIWWFRESSSRWNLNKLLISNISFEIESIITWSIQGHRLRTLATDEIIVTRDLIDIFVMIIFSFLKAIIELSNLFKESLRCFINCLKVEWLNWWIYWFIFLNSFWRIIARWFNAFELIWWE